MEEHHEIEPAVASARPSASIVLATHSRPEFLADCVASLAAAMREGDELIVRECCNADAAAPLAALGGAVRHMSSPHEAKSAKLNAAIRSARGDVILITDDDCRVPPDWVDAMTRPFTNPAVGVAFGPVVGLSAVPGGSHPPALAAGPAPPELWNYAHGASMAVRRSAVIDVGGFDERLGPGAVVHGEEADLVLRLAARGWTCEIADAAPVHHLDWRDDQQTMHNLLVYARGGGAYLGMGLRRSLGRTIKPLVLRVLHETGYWRDPRTRGRWFGPRMSVAFTAGLFKGMTLPPRRFLDAPQPVSVSDSRVRVLWVTDEPPDRHQGGGNIRQAMLLDALPGRVDVTLLLAGRLEDDATRARVRAVLEVPPVRRPHARSHTARRLHDLWLALGARHPAGVSGAARVRRVLRPVLERVAGDYDVVIVHHLYLAPLLPARRRAQWLLHLFDVSSERARQELAGVQGRRQRWLLRREIAKAARYERHAVASYDGLIAVSDADAAALAGTQREPARAPVTVIPNGVDPASFVPTPLPPQPNVLLPGTLSYRPNVLGAVWFCNEVLPLVRAKIPSVRFALVGREPVPEIVALASRPGVEVHADVPLMAPWLAWARVVVVPLHVGTGTRLKALEAMAASRPVVGTSIGLEGLGIVDGVHARVVDDPAEMAEAIVELCTTDSRPVELAAAGRRHVEAHFRWSSLAQRLADALDAAAHPANR